MAIAEQLSEPQAFEQRYYEYWRHQSLAPEIGGVAIKGYEKRFYDELTSGLAEALKGTISTHYSFEMNDGRLVAEDGEPVCQLLERGLAESFALSSRDHLFYEPFLMARAHHEYNELLDWEAMATGQEDSNIVLTFSPYSEEFATSEINNQKLREAAQKPHWQRTMLRLAHWDGQRLHILTRSMDNSNVELLKETARRLWDYNFEANDSTSMLGERLRWRIEDDSWQNLLDKATDTADAILQQGDPNGLAYKQGRPIGQEHDLQRFVESEEAIVTQLIGISRILASQQDNYKSWKQAFNAEAYKYVALLESRLNGSQATNESVEDIRLQANLAGLVAQAEGKIYDMCGIMLRPESAESVAHQIGLELAIRAVQSEFISSFCPNCLPKGKQGSGKKVKAWRQGNRIGCKNCGHTMDYSDPCSPKVVRQGNKD